MTVLSEVKELVNSWPGAVALVSREGAVVHANLAFFELFETDGDSLKDRPLWDIVGLPAKLAIVRKAWAELESGAEALPIDWVAATSSARTLRLRARVTPFRGLDFAAFAIEDHTIEHELSVQIQETLAADEALLASIPVTLLRLDYQGSLVRLCDNAGLVVPGASVDGFLWTMALPHGLGERICEAMNTAKLEQRVVRFRHSENDRHTDTVVTPCGMSDTLVVLHDVSDTVRLERAQKDAGDRMRLLIEGSNNVLLLVDRELCVSYASPALTSVLGAEEETWLGKNIADLAVNSAAVKEFLSELPDHPEARAKGVFQFETATGDIAELEVDACNRLDDPLVRALVLNAHDVTLLLSLQREMSKRMSEVEQMNFELSLQATTDAMTGLHNYFSFAEHYRQAIALAMREQVPLSILLIDIDNFKDVNDTLGHLTGDTVLRGAASRISDACRKTDVVARYGGDEFVVMLPSTDASGAVRIGEIIRSAIANKPIGGVDLTVSVGAATAVGPAIDGSELLNAADTALYTSKRTGRDQTTHISESDEAA